MGFLSALSLQGNPIAAQSTSVLFAIVWVREVDGHQLPRIPHEALLCVPAIPGGFMGLGFRV